MKNSFHFRFVLGAHPNPSQLTPRRHILSRSCGRIFIIAFSQHFPRAYHSLFLLLWLSRWCRWYQAKTPRRERTGRSAGDDAPQRILLFARRASQCVFQRAHIWRRRRRQLSIHVTLRRSALAQLQLAHTRTASHRPARRHGARASSPGTKDVSDCRNVRTGTRLATRSENVGDGRHLLGAAVGAGRNGETRRLQKLC